MRWIMLGVFAMAMATLFNQWWQPKPTFMPPVPIMKPERSQ